MEDERQYANAQDLADHLRELRHRRETLKADAAGSEKKRSALSADKRRIVLSKTGERCHVCGGPIKGPWQADHVLAHSAGGKDSVDNFLPAHDLCNHYRWDYLPEEFQEILRLGVRLRTQTEKGTPVGRSAAKSHLAHQKQRVGRREG